ncbi:MAG: hypothetical protein ABJE47_11190 [bacterium]
MIPLFLLAQLALPATDSVYSSVALRDLVARAALQNHAPPVAFRGYGARVETELSLILRDTIGRESVAQTEQLASAVQWRRGGDYDMHIIGYRSQGIGVPYSTLTFVRSWTEPSLYGERVRLGAEFVGDNDSTSKKAPRDTIVAVHPFASDRDGYYRFSGGDTVTVLRSGQRVITVVRVHVQPHLKDSTRFAAFDGEIDLDAERQQIVRMRGQFVILGRSRSPRPLMSRMPGLMGVAFVEFVNTEVQGRYWLPAFQRTELQTSFALLGRTRAVMRVVSRFSDFAVDDTSTAGPFANDEHRIRRRTTWASSDSVNRYGAWRDQLGVATSSVTADDFDDVAPDAWRSTGGALLDFVPAKTDNLVRYDRVQGVYTGMEATLRMRSAVPGLTMGATGGWAWTERTVRGGVHASLQRGHTTLGARVERILPSTNDFSRPMDPDNGGLNALLGSIDDYDYVDRRLALASVTHILGSLDRGIVTLQLGAGQDRGEFARVTKGLFGSTPFRQNRGVQEGSYALGALDVELHPNVTGDDVRPGVGAKLHYEAGRGGLHWDRAELSLGAQQYWGPVMLSAHGDAGAVFGDDIPSQKLFELGGSQSLPGYEYKEFAGDRAALFRGFASYTLPVWRTPRRVFRNIVLPGLAPGFAAGFSGGWTDLSSAAATRSVVALGAGWSAVPVSRATGGARTTVGLGLTFFGGNLHLGVARPVDHPSAWKFVLGSGPAF